MKRLAFYFVVILLSCTKETITPRDYPRVSTVTVSDISGVGAVFHGEIVYTRVPVTDYGFVWAKGSFPTLGGSATDQLSLGSTSTPLPFEAKIERSLEVGKSYTVRAYAISVGFVVYGPYVDFIAQGSLPPVLTDFQPKVGTWNDTITVTGSNFSKGSLFKFDAIPAIVVTLSESQAKILVPLDFLGPEKPISISFSGNTSVSTQTFKLNPPTITDFNPKHGGLDAVITIIGTNFHPTQSGVQLNNVSAPIVSMSLTKIVCKLPANVPYGAVPIKVTSGNQTIAASTPFFNERAVLTGISPTTGTYDDIVTLTGDYFGAGLNANIVKFDNWPAEIISASTTEIKVKVPWDIQVPTTAVTVLSNQQVTNAFNFTLLPPTITSVSPSRGILGTAITITGTRFGPAGLAARIGGISAIISYNPPTQINAQVPTMSSHTLPVEVESSGTTVVAATEISSPWMTSSEYPINSAYKIMVVQSRAFAIFQNSGRMFEHIAASGTWSEKAAFPGDFGFPLITFSNGTRGFVATSFTLDFWEYDPAGDSWSKKNDLPFTPGNFASGMSSSSAGYLIKIVEQEMWQYIPASDSWTQAPHFPGLQPYNSVALGSDVFVCEYGGTGDLWKYNPGSTTWTNLNSLPFSGPPQFMFTIGGKVYVSGNDLSGVFNLWIYDPGTAAWTTDLVYPNDLPKSAYSVGNKAYVFADRVMEYDPAY